MQRSTVLLTISVLLLFASIAAQAQNVKVGGRITDPDGEPIASVTVYESGRTSNGTSSDINGNYSIIVPETGSVVFSCLGYVEVSYKVPRRGVLNVTMDEDRLFLDAAEVVEIGYGSVARRDLTGSVGRADVNSMLKTAATSFDQALGGRIAGVVVTSSDGAVGQSADVVIRGVSSLTQSTGPLYVIDGFQSESSMAALLNPADIESVDVLKDASATAIYGARAANGVIIINTKQGVEGRPKVNFTASWSYSQVWHKMELMDAYDYVELMIDKGTGDSKYLNGEDGNTYTLEDYRDARTIDWQDQVYRNTLTQNYSITLSGGSKTTGTRYQINFSAMDQNGVLLNSAYQRYYGRIKLTQDIGRKVVADLNVNYSRGVTNGSTPSTVNSTAQASSSLMYSIWGYKPVQPLGSLQSPTDYFLGIIEDEDISTGDYRFNPVVDLKHQYKKNTMDLLNAQTALTYTIIPGLVFKTTGNYQFRETRNEQFNDTLTSSGWERSVNAYGVNATETWLRYVIWSNENTLTWTKRVKDHHLTMVGGVTFQGETRDYQGVKAITLSSESLGIYGMNSGSYQPVTPYKRAWTLMSGLFRLQYDYKYKYYLTASFRADGSSKFADGHRWGYFPSGALSWTFSREPWLKAKWFTNGKLRASWGMTGNNNTSTPYDYYAQITTSPGTGDSRDYVINGEIVQGYYPSNMGNEALKWETTEQWDVGLDLSFFKGNRIKLTTDWYLKNTRDLLLNATIPASTGFTTCMMNIGSIRNMGVEISLETVNIDSPHFQWTTQFNIALNRNTVTGLSAGQNSLMSAISWDSRFNAQNCYIAQVGKPAGCMYGFIYEGTYKVSDFDYGVLKDGIPYIESVGKSSTQAGDAKYRDINGDGIINDNDRTIIGCGQPLHTGGFNNTFYFYGFDLNVFFSWSYGNDILNANRLIFESGFANSLNQLKSYTNRYSSRNPDSDIPRANANGILFYSSRVIEDGSFLRLKNISLGYTIPVNLLKAARISDIRIYVSADNIYTFTNYSGPDPEVSTKNSALTPGFDWAAYPRCFGFTGGLQLTF